MSPFISKLKAECLDVSHTKTVFPVTLRRFLLLPEMIGEPGKLEVKIIYTPSSIGVRQFCHNPEGIADTKIHCSLIRNPFIKCAEVPEIQI
jgi:hypothetical protein